MLVDSQRLRTAQANLCVLPRGEKKLQPGFWWKQIIIAAIADKKQNLGTIIKNRE